VSLSKVINVLNRARSAVGRAQGLVSQGSEFDPDLFHKACYMPFTCHWRFEIKLGIEIKLGKKIRFEIKLGKKKSFFIFINAFFVFINGFFIFINVLKPGF
jgi:hypothetical protein